MPGDIVTGGSLTVSGISTFTADANFSNTVFDGTVTLKNNLIITTPSTTLTQTELSYLDGATSNIQAQIGSKVNNTGNESIAGIKTFTSVPICATNATALTQLTNKSYVDDAISGYVTTTTSQSITGLKNFVGQVKLSGTGGLNASNVTQEFTDSKIYRISNNVNDGKIEFWLNTTDGVSTRLFYLHYPSAVDAGMYLSGYTFYRGNSGGTTMGHETTTNFIINNTKSSGTITISCNNAGGSSQTVATLSAAAATFNNNNITAGAGIINYGQGAGDASNLICGNTNAKSVVFTTNSNNTVIGTSAGGNMLAESTSNTLIGNNAGFGITSSTQNTFIGVRAGNQGTGTGSNNVCVGYQAGTGMTNTVNQNTLVGSGVATLLTTGVGNCIYGFSAASALATGNNNSIYGLQAGDNITGSNNICIGSGSAVPVAGGSNQIAIGTINETMYIRGGFNWRVGTQIIATIDLSATILAQFYTVAMTAASQTITLPNPTGAAYLGARVTFKRKTNTTAFNLASAGSVGFVPIVSITVSASPISIGTGVFQVDLICDGVNWCIIGQA